MLCVLAGRDLQGLPEAAAALCCSFWRPVLQQAACALHALSSHPPALARAPQVVDWIVFMRPAMLTLEEVPAVSS